MTHPPLVDVGPHKGARYRWDQPSGNRCYVRVLRVVDGEAHLRCHHPNGRISTIRCRLPLWPSLTPYEWSTADLLELIP